MQDGSDLLNAHNHSSTLPNGESNCNSFDKFDEEATWVDVKQYKLSLQRQLKTTKDIMDNGFEGFVQ
jgi:hypothetical protein